MRGLLRFVANAALALAALAVLALPAVTYRYVRTEVRVADRYPAPALPPLSPVDRAEYAATASRPGTSFVVLGYHDLATARETMEGGTPLTVSVVALAAQLRMLAATGYRSVTAAQVADAIAGRAALPPRAVLITFEGGHARTWTHADPVLAHYGYQAVVFVDPARVGEHRFLNWDELTAMVGTRRWSIGVAAPRAAAGVPVDAHGTQVSGLLARRWLRDGDRVENADEYQRRVGQALSWARDAIAEHELPRPRLFSYPFQPGYPFDRVPSGFADLVSVVNRYFDAGVLSISPDRTADPWWMRRRLLPRSVVYGATTDRVLNARLGEGAL